MTHPVATRTPDPDPAAAAPPPARRLADALRNLLAAAVDVAAGAALRKVDDLAGALEDATARGGVGLAAALGAGRAMLAGTSPVLGAIKAGFAALGLLAKTMAIIALVLSPVLLLVLLLVLVLAALVVAIVRLVRAVTG